MSPRSKTIWLWLTAPIAVLVAIAAGVGLFIEDLYRDPPSLVAQATGQDVVTLVVALPSLVTGAILASRGSARGRLVWLGVLGYVVYTYVTYTFGIRFNPLFLVYVALLGCSLYALIGGLATTDFEALKVRFTQRTPVKAASIFLAVVAILFYLVWLSEALPAVLVGGVPQSVLEDGTPTNVVHVVDMAWLLPGMLLTAVWLWRKRAIGYVLAGALLTLLALLKLAIVAMAVVDMSLYGATGFGILSAISLGMLVWYLRGLKE
ncbi:MAG TPA: hypothetical protein VK902_19920 [Rubrobacter sp.]|jgi:hypothetical protein|nr:hypothetical protein [Rubrobacter sp.]